MGSKRLRDGPETASFHMIAVLLLCGAATGLAPAPSTSAAPRTSYLGSLSTPATAEAEAARKKGSSLPVMAAILLVFALIGLWLRSQSSGSGKAEGKRWQRKNTADGKRLKRANTKY